MKSEENKKLFQRLNKILSGSDGIVYLMFLGRDTYAAKIKDLLLGTIFRHDSNVNQVVNRLLKHGSEFLVFKRKYRKEKTPGRAAKIYTASFHPIFLTLEAFNVNFDKKELRFLIESLSASNDAFPEYLTNMYEKSMVLNWPWHITLAHYFAYISDYLRITSLPVIDKTTQIYSILPTSISIPKETIDSLLNKYPDLEMKFASMTMQLTLARIKLKPKYLSHLEELIKARRDLLSGLETIKKFEPKLKELENFLNLLKQADLKDIESTMEYIERIRETEEFLKWKMEKEQKRKKEV